MTQELLEVIMRKIMNHIFEEIKRVNPNTEFNLNIQRHPLTNLLNIGVDGFVYVENVGKTRKEFCGATCNKFRGLSISLEFNNGFNYAPKRTEIEQYIKRAYFVPKDGERRQEWICASYNIDKLLEVFKDDLDIAVEIF